MSSPRVLLVALIALALLPGLARAGIVYDCQNGSLCIAGADGSDPASIADGNYFHPALSADGRTLAAGSNDGVSVFNLVTRQHAVISGDYPFAVAISPDGTRVADVTGMCDCANHPIVCVYAIADTGHKLCDSQAQPAADGVAFGPDGRLYTAQNYGGAGSICRRAAAQATCDTAVVSDSTHELTRFDISPDGKRVVAELGTPTTPSAAAGVAVYDLITGAQTAVLSTSGADTDPAWSRDGKRVLFTRGDSLGHALYEVPATGGKAQLLIPDAQEAAVGADAATKDPGLEGFSAKADGAGVAGKVLIGVSGSDLKVTLAGTKLVKHNLPAGRRTFRIALPKVGRKQLHKHGSLKVTLKVVVTPPGGGQSGSETKRLVLKD